MKNNTGEMFDRICAGISKLGDIRNRLETENIGCAKEIARRKIIDAIVFHETKMPLEAINDVVEMSPLALGRDCVINSSTAFSVIKFNSELVAYLQSYLSAEFDPDFVMETEFDLNELMFTALCSFYAKFKRKNVNISTRFYTSPLMVTADKYKLYCVLLNLLDNGLKFSKEGEELVITTLINEETRMLRIEFLDHGGGFSSDLAASFFPEGKLIISVNENDPKTGLIIIHKYLEEMNGYLELDSREGEGSALTLNIKLAESFDLLMIMNMDHELANFSEEIFKRLSADPFVEGALKLSEMKKTNENVVINVVVLDEETGATNKLKEVFVEIQAVLNCTFNVSILTSSKISIDDITNSKPDIIFIEPVLKSQDGFEMLKAIKSTFEISQVPVIVLSKIKCQVKASKYGAVEYVSKPINNAGLINIVKNFVLKLNGGEDFLSDFKA